jgi:hypothetical protein
MATTINFPTSPTEGQLYVYGATTYVWNGSRWSTKLQITDDVISGSLRVTNGITGSLLGTASYAVTASYALNGGGSSVSTGSLLLTASAALNVLTFTKGDGTTFPVTVNTGSGGGGITGTGTTSYIPKFTGTSAIGNSLLYDNGTTVSVNTTAPTSAFKFEVSGSDIQVNGTRIGVGAGNKDSNVAFGTGALLQNTTGFSNTALGSQTLSGNIGGFGHVAVGGIALSTVTGGYFLIGIGYNSQPLTPTDTNSIVIGSGTTGLGTNTTVLGTSGTTVTAIYGNLLLGTTSNTPSAKLKIESTTQGFLPPTMTNAQRTAISTPAIGLMVYCTDATEGLYVNKSTGWTFII